MKVILQEDVEKLGRKYEVTTVAPGYARNYLLPQGLAIMATEAALKKLADQRKAYRKQQDELRSEYQEQAKKIEGTKLTFPMKVNEHEEVFGSVTGHQVLEALQEKGLPVEKRMLVVDEPFKELGEYEQSVTIGAGVKATIKIELVKEEEE